MSTTLAGFAHRLVKSGDVKIHAVTGGAGTPIVLLQFGFHMNRDLPERLIQGREYDYVATFLVERIFDHGTYDPADVEIFAHAFALPGRTRGAMEWYRAFPRTTRPRSAIRPTG